MTQDGGYRFSWKSIHGPQAGPFPDGPPWVFVTGGALPCEVALRFHRHPDGRYVFTGMVISDPPLPAPTEVTTQLLRQIRLGEIQAEFFGAAGNAAGFDPARPPRGETPTPEAARWLADLAASHGQLAEGPSRSPADEALRAFARTYQLELARQPRRAMTTAARAHNISRATANRWAAACRERGYLPSASAEETT